MDHDAAAKFVVLLLEALQLLARIIPLGAQRPHVFCNGGDLQLHPGLVHLLVSLDTLQLAFTFQLLGVEAKSSFKLIRKLFFTQLCLRPTEWESTLRTIISMVNCARITVTGRFQTTSFIEI